MRVVAVGQSLQPEASIIIVGWRGAPHLKRCLRSVAANAPTVDHEVVVVLNEPTPEVLSMLNRGFQGLRIYTFSTNRGFGGAANYGVEQARGEFVVLLSDDCVVLPHWLESLVDTAGRRPDAGAVGSTFRQRSGVLQAAGSILWRDGSLTPVGHDEEGDGCPHLYERRVDSCSAGSLLVRREAWLAVGGMDDFYYPAHYEDVDLCLRLAAAGWQTWYQPTSVVVNERSPSVSEGFTAFLRNRNQELFRERWSTELAARCAPGDLEEAIWRARGRPGRVLVIDDRVPAPHLGSGYGRMWDCLMALAADPGLAIDFHPRLPLATDDDLAERLREVGVRIVPDLEAHLETPGVGVDVLLISRPHNYWFHEGLRARLLPDVPVVYDAEAVYYRRLEMQLALADDDEHREALEQRAVRMRGLEERLFAEADHVVCISEEEARVAAEFARCPITVIEAWLADARPTQAGFQERQDMGFVAGWSAGPGSPNADGLLWFAREVMPLVKARVASARLLVTGADPPDDVTSLHGDDIVFLGNVDDLHDFYNGIRVVISPVRFGSGVKLKSVEALQSAVPLVGTTEGVAGLDPAFEGAVFATDDPSRFADYVVALLSDETAWSQSRTTALQVAGADQREGLTVAAWPDIIRKHL